MEILNFKKTSMNDDAAKQIALWQYDGDYASYNLPTYEEMKEKNYGITNSERAHNYICYLSNEEVIAYTNMKEMEDNKIFFGIGLKPEYCGKGLGSDILKDSLKEIKQRYPNHMIYLEVRSWNKRAIKVYENTGFKIDKSVVKKDRLGNDCEFIEMILKQD